MTEEGLSLTGKEKEHPRVSREDEGFFFQPTDGNLIPQAA